jgi:murein DD-endopeptidase MepM/ murein hydrolase activator NlpD
MFRSHNAAHPKHISMTQRSLLIGLGVIGSVGLLGGDLVYAETDPAAEAIAVPSATELLPIPVAAPVAAPQPIAAPERSASPAVAPEAVSEAEPRPETPIRPQVDFSNSNTYIDTTDYGIGATQTDQPAVVLTERATGCQTAVQPGQSVNGSVCRAVQVRLQQQAAVANAPGGQADDNFSGYVEVASANSSGGSSQGGSFSLSPEAVQNFYNRTLRPLAMLGNGNTSLLYPLSIPASITSAFGWRIHPISGGSRFHQGTDIGAPQGTPVLAAFSGRVNTSDFMRGYGLTVILTHDEGRTQTLYAHLSELFVRPGDVVQQGEVIGRVGSTGNSTGPHLHFEYLESTPQGWVARDAGYTLQMALSQFLGGFQVAKLPLPQLADWDLSTQVEGLADFGKLVSDVLPEVTVAQSMNETPLAKVNEKDTTTEVALPEVVVPAIINR